MTPLAAIPEMNILSETERREYEKYLVIYSWEYLGERCDYVNWAWGKSNDQVEDKAWAWMNKNFKVCDGYFERSVKVIKLAEVEQLTL